MNEMNGMNTEDSLDRHDMIGLRNGAVMIPFHSLFSG